MLTIVKTPRAFDDLEGIALDIADHNPEAAMRFLDAAEETFQMLSFTPYIGQRVFPDSEATSGYRVRTIIGFRNYIAYYRAHARVLEVVRVVHGARDQQPLVEDLS